MKKRTIILTALFFALIFGLILILSSHQTSAVDLVNINQDTGEADVLGLNPDNVPQTPEEGTSYLKQEWAKILEKSQAGRVLLKISDILTSLNFFWKPVLGMEYSLSWAFIFGVAIWFILFYIVYGAMNAFFDNKLFEIMGAFCVASLVGLSGVIKKAVDLLSFAIKNKWIAGISLVIAILVMVLIVMLSGGLKEYLKKQKEKEEKSKTEKAQKVIQTQGKIAEKELESYKDEGGGI